MDAVFWLGEGFFNLHSWGVKEVPRVVASPMEASAELTKLWTM